MLYQCLGEKERVIIENRESLYHEEVSISFFPEHSDCLLSNRDDASECRGGRSHWVKRVFPILKETRETENKDRNDCLLLKQSKITVLFYRGSQMHVSKPNAEIGTFII